MHVLIVSLPRVPLNSSVSHQGILGMQTICQNAQVSHSMLQKLSQTFYTVIEYRFIYY